MVTERSDVLSSAECEAGVAEDVVIDILRAAGVECGGTDLIDWARAAAERIAKLSPPTPPEGYDFNDVKTIRRRLWQSAAEHDWLNWSLWTGLAIYALKPLEEQQIAAEAEAEKQER